ncbi:MAG: hypothetical protein IJP68_08810, partial [Selenomonadaceae bacterium]|nr:hypothetical protein [Selenomonadaceae bacterium]
MSISGGSYSTQESGNDILVKVGSETITLKNVYASANKLHINKKSIKLQRKVIKLTADNKDLDISRDSLSVVGSSGNDTIRNNAEDVTINAGAGNDYIMNWRDVSTISGGKGNDSIRSYGANVALNGGAGNDYIESNSWSDVTINGGTGNDLISLGGGFDGNNLIRYKAGDGNDSIVGFGSASTLSISGGSYSTQVSGNDVIVKVGTEKIRLKYVYATADEIHINKKSIALNKKFVKLSSSDDVIVTRNDLSVAGSAGNDSIDNYGN